MTYDLTTEHGRAQAHADGSPLAGIVEKALAESACEQLQEVSQLLENIEVDRIFGASRLHDFDKILTSLGEAIGTDHPIYEAFFDLQTDTMDRQEIAMQGLEELKDYLLGQGVR